MGAEEGMDTGADGARKPILLVAVRAFPTEVAVHTTTTKVSPPRRRTRRSGRNQPHSAALHQHQLPNCIPNCRFEVLHPRQIGRVIGVEGAKFQMSGVGEGDEAGEGARVAGFL
ncbi:hypothetical protein VC83_06715 [Pseudogymnoascus destructans]|uniref:Uncharacterized protein n=1 Tax=Pseudogymnoascus destructans TaxID=655981 RepID=A0A177A2T1_9PEZI|nr:uncharacterized protein VC83_06715 [Pseudogymnoascus destructans]OAF56496.1 hypothetical protein VC83_06715 [Pseudogymnoascus destructans]